MKTRNLLIIFALTLAATLVTGFVNEASAGSRPKGRVEVHERYESRGGDRGDYRYERVEVRRGGHDRHEARWERDRHQDRDYGRWEGDRHRHRDYGRWEHRHEHRHGGHRHDGYWRPHRHDRDGHVHFFFGLGFDHGGVLLGF